jgi:hypothetical protein
MPGKTPDKETIIAALAGFLLSSVSTGTALYFIFW